MITTLTGKNSFAIDEARHKVIEEHTEAFGSLAIEQFSGDIDDIRAVHAALTNVPFLVDKTLVVLNRPSEHKELTAKLPSWLEQKNETTDVLIIEPSIDKRSSWSKFLYASTDLRDFQAVKEAQLDKWIEQRAKELGMTIGPPARQLLARYCALDQLRINSELEKLSAYRSEIDSNTIRLLVEPSLEETVFHLLDTLFSGQLTDVYKILEELQLRGTDPHEIISMIGWQLTTLAHIVVRASSSPQQIAQASGLHPFVVQKNLAIARRLSPSVVTHLLEKTVEAELRIKRDGEKSERVIQLLIAQIADILQSNRN